MAGALDETMESALPPGPAERLAKVRARYEAAYAAAEAGGRPPTVDLQGLDDADAFPEPARTAFLAGLAAIDAEFRARRAASPDAPTIDHAPRANVSQDETLPPEPQHATEFDLKAGRPPSVVNADLDATMSVAAPPAQATVDFDGASGGGADFTLAGFEAARPAERPKLPEIEGYKVVQELKKGGMGVVYKAWQVDAGRFVAIKMILGGIHADDAQVARFADDSRLAAQLDDEGIVKIHQIGRKDGLPYFSLEFVEGGSLADVLADKENGGPRQPAEAARIVERLGRSMQVAHDHKIIHRDLKPANVLMTRKGEPKITDFGLAKRLDGDSPSGLTQTGQIMGTPSYMAPEQARGLTHEIGPPADIYALGAILYELSTGRPPFQAATIWDTIDQVITQEPVPPRRLQPKLPIDLETIALKCLQKEPARRYASAGELADDLARFLRDEPIVARPISDLERAWRWCRRNPRLATLNAAVALLLVGIAAGSTYAAFRIEKLREAADAGRLMAVNNANIVIAARGEAERNATLAVQQAGVALDTAAELITGVQREIPDSPKGRILKDRLLRAAGVQLVKIARTGENSTFMDRSMAAVHQKLGRLLNEVGDVDEAIAQLEQAHEMTRTFWEKKPDDLNLIHGLSGTKNDLADVLAQRRREIVRARELYQEALDLRKDLVAREPGNEMWLKDLATSHGLVARIAMEAGDLKAAREEFDEETKVRDSFSAALAGGLPRLRERASQNDNLSKLFFLQGDFPTARSYAEKAMRLRTEYGDAEANPGARSDLAFSCIGLADLEMRDPSTRDAARLGTSEVLLLRAIEILKPLLAADPGNIGLAMPLAMAEYRLGLLMLETRPAEAPAHFKEARDRLAAIVARDPKGTNLEARLFHLIARSRSGEDVAAAAGLDDVLKALPKPAPPEDLYNIACGFAACAATAPEARASGHAARAFEVLGRARAAGWSDLVGLQTDPDLAAIRTLPEYARLVDELKAKGSKGVITGAK